MSKSCFLNVGVGDTVQVSWNRLNTVKFYATIAAKTNRDYESIMTSESKELSQCGTDSKYHPTQYSACLNPLSFTLHRVIKKVPK